MPDDFEAAESNRGASEAPIESEDHAGAGDRCERQVESIRRSQRGSLAQDEKEPLGFPVTGLGGVDAEELAASKVAKQSPMEPSSLGRLEAALEALVRTVAFK